MTQQNIEIRFGGRLCLLNKLGQYPQASEKANSFYCPLGPEPGRGWVLMLRQHLDQIIAGGGLNQPQTLEFRTNTKVAKFPQIYLHKAHNVSGGALAKNDRAYLVELLDKRAVLKMMWIAKSKYMAYNCTFPPGANRNDPPPDGVDKPDAARAEIGAKFYPQTLNESVSKTPVTYEEWTWQTMLDDLWTRLSPPATVAGIKPGPSPTLPFDPKTNPRNWNFNGMNPWEAISIVLAHLYCAVAYDPIKDKFSYVALGTNQPGLQAAINLYPKWIDDADVIESVVTRIPDFVFVGSRIEYKRYGSEPLWGSGGGGADPVRNQTEGMRAPDVNGTFSHIRTNVPGVQRGTVAHAWDDQPLVLRPGVDTSEAFFVTDNEDDLVIYDGKIVSRWTRDRTTPRERRVFQGVCPEFLPGSIIKAVLWRNWGDGFQTEIMQGPGIPGAAKDGCDLLDSLQPPDEFSMRGRYNRNTFQRHPPQDVLVATASISESSNYVLPEEGTHVFSGAITYYVPEDGGDGEAGHAYQQCWIVHINSINNQDGPKMDLPMLIGNQLYRGFACGMASFGQTETVLPPSVGNSKNPVRPIVIIDTPLVFEAQLTEELEDLDGGSTWALATFLDLDGIPRGEAVRVWKMSGAIYPAGTCDDNQAAALAVNTCAVLPAGTHVMVRWIRGKWRIIETPYGVLQPPIDFAPSEGTAYDGLLSALKNYFDTLYQPL